MFDLAAAVLDRIARSEPVSVVRVVDSRGFSSREPAAAAAFDHTGRIAGQIFAGAADQQLTRLVSEPTTTPRIVELAVTEADALGAGLTCGGDVRVLIEDASAFGGDFWQLMTANEPCVLVTPLETTSDEAVPTPLATLIGRPGTPDAGLTGALPADLAAEVRRLLDRGSSLTSLVQFESGTALVTVLWPTPTVVVVGEGQLAAAVVAVTSLLGWNTQTCRDATVQSAIERLRPGDAVLVLSHDLPLAGPALRAALLGPAGYVGALGSRRTQSKRRDWLAANGVPAELVDQIRGPAGLDVGALTPAEIAVAITAEMLAVRTGRDGRPLSTLDGPIHRSLPAARSSG